jgi:hypothetical protein
MGFRVVPPARPSVDVLGMVISTQSDLVIVSAAIKGLSGIDMSRAMSAMSTTVNIPILILSSFRNDHQVLSGAPGNMKNTHIGSPFVQEITAGLEKANLLWTSFFSF